MDIYERIKLIRKQRGLSQEELADKVGVSRQAVSKWESGLNIPDTDKVVLLSEVLGVSTDYLLLGRDDEPIQEAEVNEEVIPEKSVKKRITKKVIIIIASVVLIIAIAVGVILYKSKVLDIIGIAYSPDCRAAAVIYETTVDGPDGEKFEGFSIKDYEGLRGTKFEQFILKYFPYQNNSVGFGGTLESFTWLPDDTGYILKLEFADAPERGLRQIYYISNTDNRITNIGACVKTCLHNEVGYLPGGDYDAEGCPDFKVDFLMIYEKEAIFSFEYIDNENYLRSGWVFADIDELSKIGGEIDAIVYNE